LSASKLLSNANTEDTSKECFSLVLRKSFWFSWWGNNSSWYFLEPVASLNLNPQWKHLPLPNQWLVFKSSSTDGLITCTHTFIIGGRGDLPWNTRKFLAKNHIFYSRISPLTHTFPSSWPADLTYPLCNNQNLATEYTPWIFVAMDFKLWTLWVSWWICCW
jgi:hypothetical protein